MGKPAKFSRSEIFAAALELLSQGGPKAITVLAVARRLGAPSGSMYHRFPTRDLLLAELWLDCVERFQSGFVKALESDDPDLILDYTWNFIQDHPGETQLLSLYRRQDLIEGDWPVEVQQRSGAAQEQLQQALSAKARQWGLELERVVFALVELPYSLRGRISPQRRQLLGEAVRALLREGKMAGKGSE